MGKFLRKQTIYSKIWLVFLLLASANANAYLDPGSGSMLLYFLIGIFATLLYSIQNIFLATKSQFLRFLSKDKVSLKTRKNVVFYSEGGHYWTTFKPVVKHLTQMGVICSYYTSDDQDAGLSYQAEGYDSLFIGRGNFAMMSLNFLKAKVLIVTTPQLDVMHFKRSKNVQYFIHMVHAPTDIFAYKPFAFDFFDCIMCAGSHQIKNIRFLEKARNMPKKLLLETGLLYFDGLMESKELGTQDVLLDKKTILVAPTWGETGLLSKIGFSVIEVLLDAGFVVVLRPHPQSYIYDKALMSTIAQKAKQYSNLTIDRSANAEVVMQQADIMLSDLSGIIFDFAFVYEKPVIALSNMIDKSKLLELQEVSNYCGKDIELWEIEILPKVATLLDISQIKKLPEIISGIFKMELSSEVALLRDKSVFNYGMAGKTAALQIHDILKEKCQEE